MLDNNVGRVTEAQAAFVAPKLEGVHPQGLPQSADLVTMADLPTHNPVEAGTQHLGVWPPSTGAEQPNTVRSEQGPHPVPADFYHTLGSNIDDSRPRNLRDKPANYGGVDHKTGDLEGRDHEQTMMIINTTLEKYYSHITDGTNPEARAKLQSEMSELTVKNERFRRFVEDDSNYEPGAREAVTGRLRATSERLEGEDTLDWIARRSAQFSGKPQAETDLDGTLTDKDPNAHAPEYEKKFPGNPITDMLQTDDPEGKDWTRTFVTSIKPGLDLSPELFRLAAKDAKIRPGVAEFFRWASENDMPIVVDSASFEPFVVGVLEKIPHSEEIKYAAVRKDDITATLKRLHAMDLALQSPDKPLFYVGDGTSDKDAIKAKDYIAGWWALEGSGFAQQLETEGVPYRTYRDINDVVADMAAIQEKRQALQAQG